MKTGKRKLVRQLREQPNKSRLRKSSTLSSQALRWVEATSSPVAPGPHGGALRLATPKGPPSARIMGPAEAPATSLPMPPRTPWVEPGGLRQEADVLRFERPIFRALEIGALGGGPRSFSR